MSDPSGAARIDDAVGGFELGGKVVGVQDGNLGGGSQSLRTQQADIGVGDGKDAGTAVGSRSDSIQAASLCDGV
ncbi:hypothetical protein Barb7_02075 [Bacteroidales bacterium Barb7]|nr:hypothetical protein Barb7_02075 [Bacteroidales bacterium Barb7]